MVLTRIGIPVSTTFLVLSAFASTLVLEKMLVKSIVGYGIAATVAYFCWIAVSKFINEKFDEVKGENGLHFGVIQFGYHPAGYGGSGYHMMLQTLLCTYLDN